MLGKYNIQNLTNSIISFTELGITLHGKSIDGGIARGVSIETESQANEVRGIKALNLIQVVKICEKDEDGNCKDCSCDKEVGKEDSVTKTEAKVESKPKTKTKSKPTSKTTAKATTKTKSKAKPKAKPKPKAKAKAKPTTQTKTSTKKSQENVKGNEVEVKNAEKAKPKSIKSVKKSIVDSPNEEEGECVVMTEGGASRRSMKKSDGSRPQSNAETHEKPLTEDDLFTRRAKQEQDSIDYAENLDETRKKEKERFDEQLRDKKESKDDVVIAVRDGAKKVKTKNSAVPGQDEGAVADMFIDMKNQGEYADEDDTYSEAFLEFDENNDNDDSDPLIEL